MSTNAVSSLQKVWVQIRLWRQHSFQAHTYKHEVCPPWVKKRERKRVPSWFKWFQFCAGVSNVGSYERNAWCIFSCPLPTYSHLNTSETLPASWQFSRTCGIISYGSGWRKDAVNQCLEFGLQCHHRGTLYKHTTYHLPFLFYLFLSFWLLFLLKMHISECCMCSSEKLVQTVFQIYFLHWFWIIFCPIKSYTCCF